MSGRVLIIDDELGHVLLIEEYLARTATETRSVTDSRSAVDAFMEFQPDIVLLDLHMPYLDGREILRRLSAERSRLGFVPVVVMTADHSKVARQSALLLGANDFLLKPLDREDAVLRVRNLLHTRRLFVELAEAVGALRRTERGNPPPGGGGLLAAVLWILASHGCGQLIGNVAERLG
jgi:putative two-component system response regulator